MAEGAEATRRAILASGLRLLHERGPYVGVTHIRLREAAAAAHLTTGAAYHVWEHQDAFHRDLATAAIRWRSAGPVQETVAAIRAAVRSGAGPSEVIRLGAAANVHDPDRDRGYLTAMVMRVSSAADSQVRAAAVDRHQTAMDAWVEMLTNLMLAFGRRMRPPLQVVHLVTAMNALSEGFNVQVLSGVEHPHIMISDGPDGAEADWTLLGLAAEGVIARFTEPDPDAE